MGEPCASGAHPRGEVSVEDRPARAPDLDEGFRRKAAVISPMARASDESECHGLRARRRGGRGITGSIQSRSADVRAWHGPGDLKTAVLRSDGEDEVSDHKVRA